MLDIYILYISSLFVCLVKNDLKLDLLSLPSAREGKYHSYIKSTGGGAPFIPIKVGALNSGA